MAAAQGSMHAAQQPRVLPGSYTRWPMMPLKQGGARAPTLPRPLIWEWRGCRRALGQQLPLLRSTGARSEGVEVEAGDVPISSADRILLQMEAEDGECQAKARALNRNLD